MKAKLLWLAFLTLLFPYRTIAQKSYSIQHITIQTRWIKDVSTSNALNDYPRPHMIRANWMNLNGLWDYAITAKDAAKPVDFDGQILVPYPLESALSGVKKALLPNQNLWYKRSFEKPPLKAGERLKLNFGAVDYEATVFVNGTEVGKHEGGYFEFSFDITSALKNGSNEIAVKVFDPTDQGVGQHGKQVLNPANIYYTPTSGIWQTVWLETVSVNAVINLVITPDIDKSLLNLAVNQDDKIDTQVEATAYEKGKKVADWHNGHILIPNAHLWSPSDPFLYDLIVRVKKNGKVVDEVNSYFGMRKIGIGKDEKGLDRIMLNNKPYYNLGTLDQGFWPEGLYTAPTDEALSFDIKAIKAMGFNTIRKHIKVEPARWYYWADKLGMLVWQDMVNPNQGLPEGSKAAFERGCKQELAQLHNYPCITTWVLFNEKWGQYDQKRLTDWIKETDPSRILNGHSGELLYVNEQLRSPSPDAYVDADMTDVHAYPDPMMSIKQPGKAQVCGEFGGIGVFIPDHQWLTGNAWGYIQEKPAALKAKYTVMQQHLQLFQQEGLSGSIYTQPFDVEGEQNGLMTYDREVIKIPFAELRRIHSKLNPDVNSPSWMANLGDVAAQDADLTEPGLKYSVMLDDYIKGNRDAAFLKKMAMMATQAGDKPGAVLAGNAYIASLKLPLSDEDIQNISQFTKSTKDPGFALMQNDADAFKKVIGDRQFTVNMMNMIFKGELEPMLNSSESPDWNAIEVKAKTYGAAGEEIFLRAKTVALYNKQDWSNYVTTANQYLTKYGKNISEQEQTTFQQAINQHK
ncbi:glycoside hydrolase family 2 protein [Mucilaginibacter paludis]|uniref:Glycoside hydrolase family 2 sugar binding n=1 Tax=Mucilaginibacter paludis DSM 18603 TaxID=714943 RepID=H1YEC2_9SPHI|nr:glycoside hydrolase family 2 [Mucilaginibacter paludis]EHQ26185.1 glycoside hydrolase family 2 sugar binding [Mucilaginibacter paludis DSM 18603]